jgi:suppressor of tumorigenicity protein 13
LSYINRLVSELNKAAPHTMDNPEEMDTDNDGIGQKDVDSDEPPFPPMYAAEVGSEDYEMASNLKQEASALVSDGDLVGALEKYTATILAAPPSSLLYANRATVLYKLQRYRAAERDCNEALKENPDSAKALRIRGKTRKELGMWDEALHDLSASQQIDYDEDTVADLKFLAEKHLEHEKIVASERIEHEERLRKKAADIKKAQEDAANEARNAHQSSSGFPGGMPGGGMGAGMPGGGMEGMMGAILSDPELMAAMQNPKVQAALQELMTGPGGLMGNPAKIQELMSDPEVGPIMQKLMAKLGGGVAMGGGANPPATDEDDGIPNLDDLDGGVDLDNFS